MLLAIKPQVFDAVTATLGAERPSQQLVISILAGMPLARLEAFFVNQPVVRAMPNTPATVGAGMTAIAAGRHVPPSPPNPGPRFVRSSGRGGHRTLNL